MIAAIVVLSASTFQPFAVPVAHAEEVIVIEEKELSPMERKRQMMREARERAASKAGAVVEVEVVKPAKDLVVIKKEVIVPAPEVKAAAPAVKAAPEVSTIS
ncbi:MAG: hypothetical protein WDW38_006724 [Sanguina aurantia]